MKRTWLLVASVLVALFATAALGYGAEAPTVPFDTNVECLQCHSVAVQGGASLKVDFDVPGTVNYEKCRACHQNLPDLGWYPGGDRPSHYHFGNDCGECHNGNDYDLIVVPPGAPRANGYLIPTAYGFFVAASSPNYTSRQLHAMHTGNGWVEATLSPANPQCSSCHATASCSACHDAPIAHGAHSTPTYPGRTLKQANGTGAPIALSTCVDPACHSLSAAGTSAFTPQCLSCHPSNVGDHGGNHSYTAASDYSEATQSGCSNSGAGCHGEDSSYSDMRGLYGHSGCTTGPCHTSTSKPSVTAPLDCEKCHAGSYAGAPDRFALTDAYPGGHFNEATHTAVAMSRSLTSGGSATASCSACHASALPAAHAAVNSGTFGLRLGCGECHNDMATNGYLQVTANWSTSTCEDCHTISSAAPMHGATTAPVVNATASTGCASTGAGCHSTSNLHALHKDASGCGLTGCHVLGAKPTKTSCGASGSDCHVGLEATHYAEARHTASGDFTGSFQSVACSACHTGVLEAAHVNSSASTCTSCHNAAVAVPVITAATPWSGNCGACHAVVHDTFVSHAGQPVAGTCVGAECHPNNSTDLVQVHSGLPNSCALTGCHDAANKDKRPTKKTCGTGGACHDGKLDGNHGGDHTYTSASDYNDVDQTGCTNSGAGCHGTDRTDGTDGAYANMRSLYGHTGCMSGPCHTSPSKQGITGPLDCVKCHAGTYVGAPDRFALTDAYPNGHYNETTHTVPNGIMTTRYVSAGGTANAACIVCHDRTLPIAHEAISSLSYGSKLSCAECHNDLGTNGLAQVQSGWTTDHCEDCHTIGSAAPVHGAVAPVVAAVSTAGCAGSGAGCHASANLHELHKDGSSCQIGCHTKDRGAATKSCGSADSNCHKYYDSGHFNVIDHTATGDITGSETVACVKCHSGALPAAHTNTAASTCSGCHADAGAAAVITAGWDKNCSACHAVKHAQIGNHVGEPVVGNTCIGSGCHPNNSTNLIAVHSGRANSCELSGCHDAANKDKRPTKKSCGTGGACHNDKLDGNHGGDHSFTAASDYNATTGAGCTNSGTGCHVLLGRDIRAYHPSSGCQTGACHNLDQDEAVVAPDECSKCHAGGYANAPDVIGLADPYPAGHYSETTHTATAMNRVVNAGGGASAQCALCHDAGMKGVHASISVAGSPYGAGVGCVECHNDTRANGNAQVRAGWSTNRCDDCHAVGSSTPMHGSPKAVTASTTAGCTTGTGCHSTELHALHKNAASCALSGCHNVKNVVPTKKSCGTGGACHTAINGDHKAQHDTTGFVDVGCSGCHFKYLTDEHAALGRQCSTCHSSTNTAVAAAITGGNRACDACHPAVNGKNYHKPQSELEFVPGNSAMHRVTSNLPGMRSSFKVSNTTYTWTLPAVNSFLKVGWTTDSVVTCDRCHTYTGSTGPHGATMKVNIDPAYPGDYQTAYLGDSGSPSSVICAKCHTNFNGMNQVHSEGDHHGSSDGKCVNCHAGVPHGWRLPRMLAYTTDPAPYRTVANGLAAISLSNRSPSNWSESNCQAACGGGDHSSRPSSVWPSTVVTVGNLSGTITNTGGSPLAGVSVTTDKGQSGTTDALGKYTFTGVTTGTYAVTATKTGYATQSKSVSVANGLTATVNFALAAQAAATNLARTGVGSASSVYESNDVSKAFDGSTTSYWRSSSGGTQWLKTDLGVAKSVSKVVVKWYDSTYYARGYRIETSENGTTWTSQYSTTSGASSGTKTHTFPSVNARYVRIYCTYANSSNYRIGEFEVWNF